MPEDAERGTELQRVNADNPESVAYWARRFRVPVEQVHAAIEAVGDEPGRVAVHLGAPWPDDGNVM